MTESQSDRLIRGGTVVDGTGATAFRADVRVRNGVISELAPALEPLPGELVHDARGCHVAPGFIESHTHFDGTMWWQPELDPLPGYGVTTVVMGNCGFALAPLPKDPAARAEVVKIFSFFEDIPERPFFENLPWDWTSWSEYKASLTRRVAVPTHYASFVGHIAIRLAAMGMDAWQRAATPEEVAQMGRDLEDALSAGALGLSTNLMDHDGADRPVPSLLADDCELRALFEILARHPGATLQVVIDTVMRMTAVEALARVERVIGELPIRLQWAGLPTLRWQKEHGIQKPLLEMHERYAREGRDFWTGYAHVPVTTVVSFDQSLLFAQSNEYVWHEVVTAVGSDAEMRAPARSRLACPGAPLVGCARTADLSLPQPAPDAARPFGERRGTDRCVSRRLRRLEGAASLGRPGRLAARERHRLDRHGPGLGPGRRDGVAPAEGSPLGRQHQRRRGPRTDVLRRRRQHRALHPVRARTRRAHASRKPSTSRPASSPASSDSATAGRSRSANAPTSRSSTSRSSSAARSARSSDVPDGKGGTTWRWTRDAAPVRLTLVDGVATFEAGRATGARPGTMLAPAAVA